MSSTAFSLRPARAADEPFVRELFADERRAEFASLGLEAPALDALLDVQFRAQRAEYRRRFPDADFLLVERTRDPVGRVIVDRTPTLLTIVDIALRARAQSQGLGTAILRSLLDEAAAAAIPTELSVSVGSRAIALYQRLGFGAVSESSTHTRMRRG